MSDLLRETLRVAVRDGQIQKAKATMARKDAKQSLQVARAPDATLRAMVAEAIADVEKLREDNARLRAELDALTAIVGE